MKSISTALRPLALAIAAIATIGSAQASTTYTFNSIDSGWYTSSGSHTITNTNTITGTNVNSFYNFSISGIAPGMTISSATVSFRARNGSYMSADASETLNVWNVTGSTPGLVSGSGAAGISIYNDLMSGALYGQTTVNKPSSGSLMPLVTVALNSNSFADILHDSQFSLGASVSTALNGQYLWSSSNSNSLPAATLTLVTQPVPEPETYAMLLAGLGLMGGIARRRSQTK